MQHFGRPSLDHLRAAIACLLLLLPLAGCANTSKDDAANCAGQGFVAGTPQYDHCVSKLQQRRTALAKLNAQEDPVANLNGNDISVFKGNGDANDTFAAQTTFSAGGGPAAAACHMARAICRRAERRCWSLARVESIAPDALKYLNRLSDLLFVIARVLARNESGSEVLWRRR